ncbi:MAG: hypothetical protein GX824_05480 [Clostridiales bacterium]|nr:hypothetical protein [Clostridiales bacterium]
MTDNNQHKYICFSSGNGLKEDKVRLSNFFKSKRFIAVVAALIFIAVMAVVLFNVLSRKNIDYAVIYSKNGNILLKADGFDADLQDRADGAVRFSPNGKLMFYTAASQKDEKSYDLYQCKTNKKKSLKRGGNIIASGVSHDFRISPDGEYLLYSQANGKKSSLYSFNLDKNKTEEITSGAEKIAFTHDGTVFFIKIVNGERILMRYKAGDIAERLIIAVKDIRLFETSEEPLLFIQTVNKDNANLFSLKKVSTSGGVEDIDDNVAYVAFDDFKPGKNLYYFKKSLSGVSWRSIIYDTDFQDDAKLQKPNREDYKISSITLFGITAYDLIGYNKAQQEYEDKLERDKMRSMLDELVSKEKLFLTEYTCYSYNGSQAVKVVDNVSFENVCAYQSRGTPRVVFKHSNLKIDTDNSITLDALIDSKELYGDNIADYARELIHNSLSDPELFLSVTSGSEPIKLSDFWADTAEFYFSDDGNALFSLVKDLQGKKSTLYLCRLTEFGVSERETIDTNVTNMSLTDSGLFYLKIDEGKDNGSLYLMNTSGAVKIQSGVSSFINCGGDIIYLCKGTENKNAVDAYIYSGGKGRLITKNISISDILYRDSGHIFCLSNKAAGMPGDLCFYDGSGSRIIDREVTKILNVVI